MKANTRKFNDIAGQKFNCLSVLGRVRIGGGNRMAWECLCDCGKITIGRFVEIKSGHKKSCGCIKSKSLTLAHTTHGMADKHPLYNTWLRMRSRCNDSGSDNYKWYGARGVSICTEWDDFAVFVADMGERPEGFTLDRIDADGNYSKDNCRWATRKQQSENTRRKSFFTYKGETKRIFEWAEKTGISSAVLRSRIKLWGDSERVLEAPVGFRALGGA